jgi:hypothetical protein
VESILDVADFIAWLLAANVVTRACRSRRSCRTLSRATPLGPDRSHGGQRATEYVEATTSGAEEGLTGVEHDRDFAQAIALGERAVAMAPRPRSA